MGQIKTQWSVLFARPYLLVGLLVLNVAFLSLYFFAVGTLQSDIELIALDLGQTVQTVSQSMADPAFVEAHSQESVAQIVWNEPRFQTSFWWMIRQFGLLALVTLVLFSLFHSITTSLLLKRKFLDTFKLHIVFFLIYLVVRFFITIVNVLANFQQGFSLEWLYSIATVFGLYFLLVSLSLKQTLSVWKRVIDSIKVGFSERFVYFIPCALFLLPWSGKYLAYILNLPFEIHPALGFAVQIPVLFLGYCFTILLVGGSVGKK